MAKSRPVIIGRRHPVWADEIESGRNRKKKGSLNGCLAGTALRRRLGSAAGTDSTCETGAEFLDAASFDDAGLSARIEGVRIGSYVALEERVSLAFVLDGFTCGNCGARNDLRASLLIQEYHFAVLGVDAFFHVDSCRGLNGSPTATQVCAAKLACTKPKSSHVSVGNLAFYRAGFSGAIDFHMQINGVLGIRTVLDAPEFSE
jgi:hypothetical protein